VGRLRLTMAKIRVVLVLSMFCIGCMSVEARAQTPEPSQTPQPTVTPTPVPTVSAEEQARQKHLQKMQANKLRKRIRRDQWATWRWQDVMLKAHTRPNRPVAHISKLGWLQRTAKYWHKRKLLARRLAHNPPYLSAWLCIHSHEGSWTAATGNGYYGGLQMDWTFMGMYGAILLRNKGPANNWTPLEQIWVAVNAAFRHHRGFYPWPNTARMCGLI
jgi:hypothetical protein